MQLVVDGNTKEGASAVLENSKKAFEEMKCNAHALGFDFYKCISNEIWSKIINIIDNFQNSCNSYAEIIKLQHSFDIETDTLAMLNMNISELNQVFPEIMGALESKDSVYIGDVLHYKIIPLCNNILQCLGEFRMKG